MDMEKPWRCNLCGKRYKNNNGLKYHRQVTPFCRPELLSDSSAVAALSDFQPDGNVAGVGPCNPELKLEPSEQSFTVATPTSDFQDNVNDAEANVNVADTNVNAFRPIAYVPGAVKSTRRPYRRPETTNVKHFWYVSQATWATHLMNSTSTSRNIRKNATNALHRFDAAGRIMETEEGVLSPDPCTNCIVGTKICKVFASGNITACAYCKRNAEGGCRASRPSEEAVRSSELVETPELVESAELVEASEFVESPELVEAPEFVESPASALLVQELKDRVAELASQMTQLQERQIGERVTELESQVIQIQDRFAALRRCWKKSSRISKNMTALEAQMATMVEMTDDESDEDVEMEYSR